MSRGGAGGAWGERATAALKADLQAAVESLGPGGRVVATLVYRKARDPSEVGETTIEVDCPRSGRYVIRDRKRPDKRLTADSRERVSEAMRSILANVVQIRNVSVTQRSTFAGSPFELSGLGGMHGLGGDFGAALQQFMASIFPLMMMHPLLGMGGGSGAGRPMVVVMEIAGPRAPFGSGGVPALPGPRGCGGW